MEDRVVHETVSLPIIDFPLTCRQLRRFIRLLQGTCNRLSGVYGFVPLMQLNVFPQASPLGIHLTALVIQIPYTHKSHGTSNTCTPCIYGILIIMYYYTCVQCPVMMQYMCCAITCTRCVTLLLFRVVEFFLTSVCNHCVLCSHHLRVVSTCGNGTHNCIIQQCL